MGYINWLIEYIIILYISFKTRDVRELPYGIAACVEHKIIGNRGSANQIVYKSLRPKNVQIYNIVLMIKLT